MLLRIVTCFFRDYATLNSYWCYSFFLEESLTKEHHFRINTPPIKAQIADMITFKKVSKYFSNKAAVDNISFFVKAGETLVLLGTSGSGKTTTLRMVNRLTEPSNGEILIDNQNILSKTPADLRRNIGYVLQNYGLFPHYTVSENIAIVPKLLHWPKEKIQKRTEELLQKFRLTPGEFMHVYPDKLSGGQKQRVGLARAMAANPPLLLMDEPLGALDPITRAEIRNELMTLDELKNKTVILVTHDVQEAFMLGSKIGLMHQGRLEQLGTPSELLFHPHNKFVKQFLSHQRLQLELNTITLKSIWNYLEDAIEKTEIILLSSQNLWQAMEILTDRNESVTAFDEKTCTLKMVKFSNLQAALKIVTQ